MSNPSFAPGRRDRSGFVVGAVLIALAGLLLWDSENLNRAVSYGFGPEVAPRIIALGLAVLGVLHIVKAVRSFAEAPGAYDAWPVLAICGGFLALTACIGLGGGFIPATTILFVVTSFAFGRRALHVDLAIGVVLATITYLIFAKLLSLSLPAGPIERIFG